MVLSNLVFCLNLSFLLSTIICLLLYFIYNIMFHLSILIIFLPLFHQSCPGPMSKVYNLDYRPARRDKENGNLKMKIIFTNHFNRLISFFWPTTIISILKCHNMRRETNARKLFYLNNSHRIPLLPPCCHCCFIAI